MSPRRLMIRPKQSLGQNFLVDDNIVRKIIRHVAPSRDDCFLEIGPGNGALSRHLIPLVRAIALIEIDGRVIRDLQREFTLPNVTIVHEDILKTDLGEWKKKFKQKFRIVGNIPYHLTSPILFTVIDHISEITDCTFMVQREVGQRIVAKPRTKEYGILSVLSRFYSSPRILFDVSPECFYPKPRVTSSVLQLQLFAKPRFTINEHLFRTIVRTTFGKRRKTLRNSLSYLPYDEQAIKSILADIKFPLDKRPEELTTDDFVELTRMIELQLDGLPVHNP
jgi:16S rRNA (adenine1518-N6/adenine1519-N6)-dimethyltransferase